MHDALSRHCCCTVTDDTLQLRKCSQCILHPVHVHRVASVSAKGHYLYHAEGERGAYKRDASLIVPRVPCLGSAEGSGAKGPSDEDGPSGSVAVELSHAHSLTQTSSIAGYLEPSARLRRSNSVMGSFKAITPRSVQGALAMPNCIAYH